MPSRLLGRERELARLKALAEPRSLVRPRLVVVEGEAGIGKTTLAQTLPDAVSGRVRWAQCVEEGASPFWLWRQSVPEVRPDPPSDRFTLFAALREVLAADQGCLLVVDDVQWADEPSLLALRMLLRDPACRGTLCCATRRTGETGHGWEHHRVPVGRVSAGVTSLRQSRAAAVIALVITGLATVYLVALLMGMPDPDWAYLLRGVIHLGELAALVALALGGAAGAGWLAKVGIGVAGLGQVLPAVAEMLSAGGPVLSDTLFAIAPTLAGIGLILTGIAVLRAVRWSGWHRAVPLALGIYVFVVMTPVIIVSGGPLTVPALWALAGWEVLWVLTAVAASAESTRASTAAPALR